MIANEPKPSKRDFRKARSVSRYRCIANENPETAIRPQEDVMRISIQVPSMRYPGYITKLKAMKKPGKL